MTLKIKDFIIPIIVLLVISAFIAYSVDEASGDLHPNTVIIFCEWNYKDYADCTKTNVWYEDFEIIKEETFSYQITVQDYKDGRL